MNLIACKIETENFKGEEGVFLPNKAYKQTSAAYDLRADIKYPIEIKPLERALIPTAVRLNIPDGVVGMVCPRSGMAINDGITVLNAPGIIDPGYVDIIRVILINLSDSVYTVNPKEKIAQLLFTSIADTNINTNRKFDYNSTRGYSGFGSSGKY